MKRPRRITKFTVETERTYIFRNRREACSGWCSECGAEVEMTTVAEAARESGLSELAIYRLIEARALHFTEDADGRVFTCPTCCLSSAGADKFGPAVENGSP